MGWEPHPRRGAHTVVGDVRVLRDVESPQLGGRRDLIAYLPPSHGEPGRGFPVVYMLDGQNLFDVSASNSGEWRVDETMEQLAREDGIEAIVVGIPSAPGDERGAEYSGPKLEQHLSFVVDTVRPLVDASFEVDPRRERTGIAGSSLGGVASLHAVCKRPETFGFAGVFSPRSGGRATTGGSTSSRSRPPRKCASTSTSATVKRPRPASTSTGTRG